MRESIEVDVTDLAQLVREELGEDTKLCLRQEYPFLLFTIRQGNKFLDCRVSLVSAVLANNDNEAI